MYFCKECGKFFTEPAHKEVWGFKEPVCPLCSSDFITETAKCYLCGSHISSDEDYCPDCQAAIEKAVDVAVASLSAERSAAYLPAKKAIADMLHSQW